MRDLVVELFVVPVQRAPSAPCRELAKDLEGDPPPGGGITEGKPIPDAVFDFLKRACSFWKASPALEFTHYNKKLIAVDMVAGEPCLRLTDSFDENGCTYRAAE